MKSFTAFSSSGTRLAWSRFLFHFFSLCLATVALRATTVVPPSFDELVNHADYVVHAVVKSVSCEWRSSGAKAHIITKVELDVKEIISGAPPVPLVIEMLGGTIGDRQMVVHGAPEFKVGDEDILFVHGNGVQANPLVALGYGRFPVKRDQQTGSAYVTRSNGEKLFDEREVSAAMKASGTRAERTDKTAPLTPEVFFRKIRESKQRGVVSHEN